MCVCVWMHAQLTFDLIKLWSVRKRTAAEQMEKQIESCSTCSGTSCYAVCCRSATRNFSPLLKIVTHTTHAA